jgi:hypothetical protein
MIAPRGGIVLDLVQEVGFLLIAGGACWATISACFMSEIVVEWARAAILMGAPGGVE